MAANEIHMTQRDMDRLIEWMRRSGRPQTTRTLARRFLEMIREDRGVRDEVSKSR